MAELRIGLDFGTNYSHVGFVFGESAGDRETVELLCTGEYVQRGIPSVYFNNGKREAFGREAERLLRHQPENGVASVKARLREESMELGTASMTPMQVVTRVLSHVLNMAEQVAMQDYHVPVDSVQVVMTVPVDFDDAQIRLLRRSVSRVELNSGHKLILLDVLQEPVAAALRYAGMEGRSGEDIVVLDLGGGTLDIAVLEYAPDEAVPYRTIDLGGIRTLGGDQWDQVIVELLMRKFTSETGARPMARVMRRIRNEARDLKEALTEEAETELDVEYRIGSHWEKEVTLHITREEFERASRPLLTQVTEELTRVLARRKSDRPGMLLLTGGSCRMPQVRAALEEEGFLPQNMELRFFKPERAIMEGAAIYARMASLPQSGAETQPPEPSPLRKIASHGYGIVYRVPELGNTPAICLYIQKGDALPCSASYDGIAPEGEEISFTVFETDVLEEGQNLYEEGCYLRLGDVRLVSLNQGREVLLMSLRKRMFVQAGTRIIQTLSMDESMNLSFQVTDERNNTLIENKDVNIKGVWVNFE